MSSPSQNPAAGPKDGKDKKGFGKVLSRVKTVFRGDGSSPRPKSTMSAAKPTPAAQTSKADAGKTKETSQQTAAAGHNAARARYEGMEGVTKVSRAQLFEERAKKLGERFGLELSASEWHSTAFTPTDDTVLRIDKPIRMRVRRNCHLCKSTFQKAKECPNPKCRHVRCTQCARYPPKRTGAEAAASREKRAALIKANKENQPIIPDYNWQEKKIVIKRPSKTGGQDLVHKKPRQRVRRTCHECTTLFVTGSKLCGKCGHARCTDCPREPPKKDKYPFGYPGDEFGPNSVPHYECEKCKTVYPTGSDKGTGCRKCGQPRTDQSPRAKPRKVEPEPDPEILKALHAKLEGLKVS